MVKLSQYLIGKLADWGVRDIFMVTGGGAMHLNDSIGREIRIRYICNHHEQASAIAAESYARIAGTPGVINVTTGPGGINALNGVFGAWTDSIPMVVISGQVKRETCMASYPDFGLRQLGDQEVDIIRMVKGITKYAAIVLDPATIRYHLERAWYLATHGRPGPVWLDLPVDVQSARIEEESLAGYDESEDAIVYDRAAIRRQCRDVLERIRNAQRPVILAGGGIRVGKALQLFQCAIQRLGIPVTAAWNAQDVLPTGHPLHCGRPSSLGDRPGNFAVQNSDVLLVLGCRLNVRQVSYNWKAFARHAFKIQVDVDPAELRKPTVQPDLPIEADIGVFLEELNAELASPGVCDTRQHAGWLAWCKERVEKYPTVLDRQRSDRPPLNPYHFTEILFDQLAEDDIVVCGDGTACVMPFQAGRLRPGQRLYTNSGCASMGYDIPAAVGAAVANRGRRVICLAGDGSSQLNIQELQTIVHHQLPVKIFILNNGGYLSIRSTQMSHFGGNLVGEGTSSGLSFPDPIRLAEAYGIPAARIEDPHCADALQRLLAADGPFVCEVMLDPQQSFEPRVSSRILPDGRMVSAPLEDLYPFLSPEELRANLLIPPMEE